MTTSTITVFDPTDPAAELDLDVPAGWSVMEALRSQRLVNGECGGMMICATCHVLIDPDTAAQLPPVSEDEDAMLGELENRQPESRLSCQLKTGLNGLRLRVADPE